jgi:hypothetical protein
MNTPEAYKAEAMRLLDLNPLDACTRVAERLNGRGWKLTTFNADVKIFDSIKWTVSVKITTDVCRETSKQKLEELLGIFKTLDLKANVRQIGTEAKTQSHTSRRYGMDYDHSRVLLGYVHEWIIDFSPAEPLELSVLTEEDA